MSRLWPGRRAGAHAAAAKCGIGRLCPTPARLNIPNPSTNPNLRCCRAATAPSPPAAMIVQVLGCSGSIAAGCRTTSFLLDDDVLIDAGTGVGDMPLDALARIEHILISHSHLDHILSIGLLADSVMRERAQAARADPGARAAGDAGRAAHAHLQRRHLARLHAPAERRAPDARARADRRRRRARAERQAHRGARRLAHRAGGRLRGRWRQRRLVGLHRRHRPEPGALGAAAQHEGRPPRDRDRVQRRRAPARPHQPAPVPGGARPRAGSSWPAASTCTSPTSSRASATR